MALKIWLTLSLFLIMAIIGIVNGADRAEESQSLGSAASKVLVEEGSWYAANQIPFVPMRVTRTFVDKGLPTSWYDPFWDDLGQALMRDGAKLGLNALGVHLPLWVKNLGGLETGLKTGVRLAKEMNRVGKDQPAIQQAPQSMGKKTDLPVAVYGASLGTKQSSLNFVGKDQPAIQQAPQSMEKGTDLPVAVYEASIGAKQGSLNQVGKDQHVIQQAPQSMEKGTDLPVAVYEAPIGAKQGSQTNTLAIVPATSQSNSAKFIKGSTVETTDSLNVRSGPGLSYNTVSNFKTTGSMATIIKGPFYADGFTWWELQYDDGTSGFSQDKRLELVPANQPSVTQQVDQPPVIKYNELAFGDNQLSVTQPVDQQPELAFGDNQQLAKQLKERVFGDNQQTGDLQPYTLPQKSNFMQLSGTQFGDYPELAQSNGYGNHIGKEHDRKYVTYFDNIRKGYYQTPARITYSPPTSPSPGSPKSGSDSGSSGLTPEQEQDLREAIQKWLDSGAGQGYEQPAEETNPVFEQCYDGACYNAEGERVK